MEDQNLYGHIAPHNIDLEENILGTMMSYNTLHDLLFLNLVPDDFYKDKNKLIYSVALAMFRNNQPIDFVTLTENLRLRNKIFEAGGINYIIDLSNKISSIVTANWEYHIKLLKNTAIARGALSLFNLKIQNIYEYDKPGNEILIDTVAELENLINRSNVQKNISFQEKYIEVIKNLENQSGGMVGLHSGFYDLDNITGGICAPDLTILAAGPGMGKSTFALNIANHVALNLGKVLYFSYEMKEEQLIHRLMSNDLNIPLIEIRKGNIPANALSNCKSYKADLKIYDKGSIPLEEIAFTAKYENMSNDVKLIVIDYLQLVPAGIYSKKGQTRNDEIGIITRKLKELAMELNVPIIALSQVNRDKHRKTYVLADLRDSGNIEQDADNVWFVFRPSEHNMDTYSIGDDIIDVDFETAILINAKNRQGQTGEIEMKFIGKYFRFEDLNVHQENIADPLNQNLNSSDNLPF